MKLIVGLGNPGMQYEKTRHNAGFMALDRLVGQYARSVAPRQRFGGELIDTEVQGERCLLLKPMRFMNCSGSSVQEAASFYKVAVSDIVVLHDDTAFPVGVTKVRGEGGHGGHNGLRDLDRALGTQAYARVRIGVGSKPAEFGDLADWVLSRFNNDEFKALEPALDRAAEGAALFARSGLAKAMNVLNAPTVSPSPEPNKPSAPPA